MQLTVFTDYAALSDQAAREMIRTLEQKPDAVICMASGSSPKGCCERFVQLATSSGIDLSQFFFIGLDEWVGLTPGMPGSCSHDFFTRLFDPLSIPASQYHLFDPVAADMQAECEKMDTIIREKGGIDLMIVGIGLNGHIGFNEPGTPFTLLSHVIDLDATTIAVGQEKYFTTPVELKQGITLGLGHLMHTRKVLLLANGTGKASVIKEAAEGPVTSALPASIMQQHPDGYIWLDKEAAAMLSE
ncbi:MAG: glucosamine-6-phosphate deaminase [Bacteroidetes bacterium]|nr:glucosamine-6-phosphate deaminase [Bacteroidota bacterium]